MYMKKIVFLAHDPGGYDVIFPVVQRLQQEMLPLDFYCLGPAAKLNPCYGASEASVFHAIYSMIHEKKLLGLVTGTSWGNHLELKAVAVCKATRIPTISVLDYWSNYKSRFQDDVGNLIYPDYYVVMDELAAREAVEAGVPRRIVKVLGHPGLDKYIGCFQNRRCTNRPTRKILFLSQPLSALYGEDLGYTEQQALEDCIRAVQENDKYILHVKFHPKDDFQRQYQEIAVQGNLIDIMPAYDLVIGMNTMGLLHAVLMGIPVISYQPNLRQADMCITNKLGFTRLIRSYEDLLFALRGLNRPDVINKNLPGCYIWLDGRSTQRAAGFIREVLGNEL